jgi:asparagine synthetase B (glutamine-hydrolysing)
MCGICFCFASNIDFSPYFKFNPYKFYTQNPYIQRREADLKTTSSTPDYFENVLKNSSFIKDFSLNDVKSAIYPRGPNGFQTLMKIQNPKSLSTEDVDLVDQNLSLFEHSFSLNSSNNILVFAASVLHLRGEEAQPNLQPLKCEKSGNILLYNGEVFNLEKNHPLKSHFSVYKNDTVQIFEVLNNFSIDFQSEKAPIESYEDRILRIFEAFINADFALVFYDNLNKKISMAKDLFGKRSLLFGIHKKGFCVTSCAPSQQSIISKVFF